MRLTDGSQAVRLTGWPVALALAFTLMSGVATGYLAKGLQPVQVVATTAGREVVSTTSDSTHQRPFPSSLRQPAWTLNHELLAARRPQSAAMVGLAALAFFLAMAFVVCFVMVFCVGRRGTAVTLRGYDLLACFGLPDPGNLRIERTLETWANNQETIVIRTYRANRRRLTHRGVDL